VLLAARRKESEVKIMSSPSTKIVEHPVKSGETLAGIARQHGVTLEALLAANPEIQDPDRIRIGQVIFVPSQSAPALESDEPAEAEPPSESRDGKEEQTQSEAGPNAILFEAESGGASDATAKQDKLPRRGIRGVKASETMAQTDRKLVMQHKEKFLKAGRDFGLPPALLAAIASRETRGGSPNILSDDGFGDGGHGFGLMQVDNRSGNRVVLEGGPFGQPHIDQATGILRDKLAGINSDFPRLSEVEKLQGAVSRYNGGARLSPPNSDKGTTGGDYMNDVWARARFYARVEQWNVEGSSPA
jgi:LysM repeat protein